MAKRKPVVIIEGFSGMTRTGERRRVNLVTEYEGKEIRIELPEVTPQYDQEPGTEVYRRELKALIAVLQEAVASPKGVLWHAPPLG